MGWGYTVLSRSVDCNMITDSTFLVVCISPNEVEPFIVEGRGGGMNGYRYVRGSRRLLE